MLGGVRLVLVRHAEAAPGEPDELRPLTPNGRESARALGEQLAADDVRPDAVLTSPLLRARETGAELGRALSVPVEPDERLAPGATAESVRQVVKGAETRSWSSATSPTAGGSPPSSAAGPSRRSRPAARSSFSSRTEPARHASARQQ